MNIGIIGSKKSIEIIKNIICENNLFINPIYVEYSDYTEVIDLVKNIQPQVDALLFTGTTPFYYASKFINPSVPWDYLPRNQISLLSALLKAVSYNNFDLSNISIDSYSEKMVKSTFKDIGYEVNNMNIYTTKFKPTESNYIDKVYEFHLRNYINKKVSFCITGMDTIFTRLNENDIPCIKVNPVSEVIIQQLNKLRLNYQIKMNESNKIATVAITINFHEEINIYGKSELQVFRNKNEVIEMIYMFAQHIDAAVFQDIDNTYYLVSSKSKIKNETQEFKTINLLKESSQNEFVKNIFIGIGFGKMAQESKYNAKLACEKSKASNLDCMFIIYEDNKVVGPITYVPKNSEPSEINKNLVHISLETGIGISTLHKLENLIAQYKIEMITPKELSRISGFTTRTINRILVKLESAGYVKVIGREPTISSGRPSRIIHINLNN